MISDQEHLAMWTEGDRSPAPQQQEFTSEQLRAVQLMAAADLVQAMREVRTLSKTWSNEARAAYQLQFERLEREFSVAACVLRAQREDREYIPAYLREGSAMPLRHPSEPALRVVRVGLSI